MLVDRQEPQVLAALRVVAPRRPGGEKVVAEPEPGLQDHEVRPPRPALRQAVAGQEDVARLRERATARVIDVVVVGRARRGGVAEVDARRPQRLAHRSARDASQRSRRSRTGDNARWSSTAGLIDTSASCTRAARKGSASACDSGCNSTWIANTAC